MSKSVKETAGVPVKITDVTLRDGQQSALATRMRIEDIEFMAGEMDKAGFYSLEVWGGATFDVLTRFLNEDPWERARLLKRLMPRTPLQMLLRGQNLVGYRNYPDDLVDAFVDHAAQCGIDIFRIFDAVNDERNLAASLKAVKKSGKHAQLCLSYSLTEARLGGPIYNVDYYIRKSLTFQEMGADSLCIKDMAGLLCPQDATELITAMKKVLRIPIQLHTHYTSGMASMSLLKAIEAGIDIIDTSLAPFAMRSSLAPIEPIVTALRGTPRDTGLDPAHLFKLGQMLESVAPKYRHFLDNTKMGIIDAGVLVHQIPGGMTSNLMSQLKEAEAIDRLKEVYEELPRTRKELGYPPLVTPTSQIVGTQAVQNVLFGRYKMISTQVKDYVYGLYGKSPAPIDPEIQKIVLKDYAHGNKPITCRAADMLPPELEKAKEATKGIAKDIGDVLIYALYPTTGLAFLKAKYGMTPPPPTTEKPRTIKQVEEEDKLIAKAKSGKLVEKKEVEAPQKGPGMRTFNVFVGEEFFKVDVEAMGGPSTISPQYKAPAPSAIPESTKPEKEKVSTPLAAAITAGETTITAPMSGIIISYEVAAGKAVKKGETVVILEAMKMQNNLPSPIDGKVKAIKFKSGDKVSKGDVLAVIAV